MQPHIRFLTAASLAGLLTGCSTVDLSQPQLDLSPRFAAGAEIRLASFSGAVGPGTASEGPALSILRQQVLYGAIRCSRPGPPLDLEVSAAFTSPDGGDRLVGVATWRDPATREVVGRRNIDVPIAGDSGDRVHVSEGENTDGGGSYVPRAQLVAGETFAARLCEGAFR